MNKKDFVDMIIQEMNIRCNLNQIRIFRNGGIELYEEDLRYIKADEILFISLGEEFDESSNFAVYDIQ